MSDYSIVYYIGVTTLKCFAIKTFWALYVSFSIEVEGNQYVEVQI